MMKMRIPMAVISDLHVAYVGNGASTREVCEAMERVRHLDPSRFVFGATFEETMMLNSSRYEFYELKESVA